MKKTTTRLSAAFIACMFLFTATAAWALDGVWNGTSSAFWTNSANWSAAYPSGAETATFTNSAAGRETTVNLQGLSSIKYITFDTSSVAAYTNGTGAVNSQTNVMLDGEIKITSTAANSQFFNCAVQLGTNRNAQSYSFRNDNAARTLTFNNVFGSATATATAGDKTLTINGVGNTTILGDITKGAANKLFITDTSSGTLTLSGSNTITTLNMNGAANSVVDIGSGFLALSNGGGTVLASTQGGEIIGTGKIWLSTVDGIGSTGYNYADLNVTAGKTLTINPEITGPGGFETYVGTGTFVLKGLNTFAAHIYLNTASTLSVDKIGNSGSIDSNLGKGTNINFNANGGKLIYTGIGEISNRKLLLNNNATLDQSGAGNLKFTSPWTVNTATKTLTLQGSTDGTGELAGALTNAATSLTKAGTGTWILSGTNTYGGATTVNGGTLLVNSPGSLGASAVTINNTGILGGNGTVNGAVTASAGGKLAPGGVGTVGTLTLGSTLNLAGNQLLFDISNVSTDKVDVAGVLTVNNANVVDLTLIDGSLVEGTYTLMTYASKSGSGSIVLSSAYTNATLTAGTTNLILTVGAGGTGYGLTWKGNNSQYWDGTELNWLQGAAPTNFVAGDGVTFNDASTNFTVASTASVSPGNLVVNSTNTYTISATVTGTAPLLKLGAGTAAFNDLNGYSPDSISLLEGTLLLGGDSQLNAGLYETNIVNNGTLNYSSSEAQTLSGVISGSGALIKDSNSTLTLTGTNTYTGATTVRGGGTLKILNGSALGTIAGGTTVTNATLELAGDITTTTEALTLYGTLSSLTGTNTYGGKVTNYSDALINVGADSMLILKDFTANGAFTKTGAGWLKFTVDPNGAGIMTVNEGVAELAQPAGAMDANVVINSGATLVGNYNNAILDSNTVTVDAGGTYDLLQSDTISALLGGGLVTRSAAGTSTLTLGGNNNGSGIFSGVIENGLGTLALTKVGTGTNTLSGANTYTGLTTVTSGILSFTGPTALPAQSEISINTATLKVLQDGIGSDGTIGVGNNITLNAAITATIDVGNNGSLNTGNTVAFGALNNGTPLNNYNSTINFTGTNGYLQSFSMLRLSGLGGQGTKLNPTTTSVTILGNVVNQQTSGAFDTLTLDGTSTGNSILGTISDAAHYTGVGNGDTRVTKSSTSTWTLSGTNTYNGPTTVSAGTLIIGGAGKLGGGVYTGTIANTGVVNYASSEAQILSGIISGPGVLVKSGSGTLTLSGINTFSGTMTNNNSLLIGVTGGTCSNSSVFVQSIGSGVTASLGVRYTTAHAQWACTNLTTLAGLSSGGAPNLAFAFGSSPSTTVAPLVVRNNLTLDATTTVSVEPGYLVTGGVYPLLVYGGTYTGPLATTITVTIGNGLTGALDWGTGSPYSTKTLVLTVGGTATGTDVLRWSGAAGTGTWDINNSVNTNWNDSTMPTPVSTNYQEAILGNTVQFEDSQITADQTVTLNSMVMPKGVTFSNSLYRYTLSGSGTIAGNTGLTKTGTNTATIATANTYYGPTTVNEGVLALSGLGTLGSNAALIMGGGTLDLGGSSQAVGAVSITNAPASGNTIQNGNLTGTSYVASTTSGVATVTANLQGTGTLTKSGAGTLTLAGTNTFSGNLTVNNGTLELTGSNALTTATVNVGATAGNNAVMKLTSGSSLIGTTGNFTVGSVNNGYGAVYLDGGRVVRATPATIDGAFSFGSATGGYGYFNMSGGYVASTRFQLGYDKLVGMGLARITNGIASFSEFIIFPRSSGSTGVLTIDGGSVYHTNKTQNVALGYDGGRAELNMTGGLLDSTGKSLSVRQGNSGSVTGIVNLCSGTLIVDNFQNTSGTALLNFNGGLLQASAASTVFLPTTWTGVYVNGPFGANAGGAKVDTAGKDITFAAPLRAPTGGGVTNISLSTQGSGYIGEPYVSITGDGIGATAVANMEDDGTGNGTYKVASVTITTPGVNYTSASVSFLKGGATAVAPTVEPVSVASATSGGLTKLGSGTLTLSGISTYSGETVINNGKLVGVTTASCSNSAVSVTATAGNSATFGVSITDNTKQWTCASLTVTNNGISSDLEFDFGTAVLPSTTLAPLKVIGETAFDTLPTVTVKIGVNTIGAPGTQYPLMVWDSTTGTYPTAVTINSLRAVTGHLEVVGKTLTLVIDTNEPIQWALSTAGIWDTIATNWVDGADAETTYRQTVTPGDHVMFNNNAHISAHTTVTLNTTVSPANVTVSNTLYNYTITGTGAIAGTTSLTKLGEGVLTLDTPNTYTGGTILSAGQLNINKATAIGAAASRFTINGGLIDNTSAADLTLTANNPQSWNGDFTYIGTRSLNLGTGAVTPNNKRQITVNANTLTVGGVISGAYGLTKAGNGTLTLTGASTYTGPTFISNGKLVGVTGVSITSVVTNNSATGNSVLGVRITDSTKQWSCNGLTFTGASTGLDFQFDPYVVPSTTLAPLKVNGVVNFTTIPAVTVSGGIIGGTNSVYPLMVCTSIVGTPPAAVDVTTSRGTITAHLEVIGTTLYLVIDTNSGILTWAASGSGTWDTASSNWKRFTGDAAVYSETPPPGDQVRFTDTYVSEGTTVTLNSMVSPASMIISNALYTYEISGSGGIAGSIGITKQGTNALTLSCNNTYTGPTTISAGMLTIGGAGQLGGGSYAANITNNGAYVYASSAVQTNSGVISGTGTLTKNGAGKLILSALNTYTGPTTNNQGLLIIQNDTGTGTRGLPSSYFVAANATNEFKGIAGGTSQLKGGTLSGNGTLVKSGACAVWLGAQNVTQYISMSGGLIDVQGGTLRNEWGRGDWSNNKASLNVASGAIVDLWDSPGGITVDALTGSGKVMRSSYGTANVAENLTVGINHGSGTFSGTITNTSTYLLALVKSGNGTQTLSGTNTYTGVTTVSGGQLVLSGASGSILSSLGYTITSGAMLVLENTSAANNTNRLRDVSAITLNNGTLCFTNTAGAASYYENAGALFVTNSGGTIVSAQAATGRTNILSLGALTRTGYATLNFVGEGIGASDRNRIFIAGQNPGLIGLWATINTTNYAAYDTNLGVIFAGAGTSFTNILAKGPSIIPDDPTLNAWINEEGSEGGISLAAAVTNRINSLLQNTDWPATVAMTNKTLLVNEVGVSAGNARALTLGTAVNEGGLTPLRAGGDLQLTASAADSVLTINAAISNNTTASSVTKVGPGTVVLMGTNTYTGTTAIGEGVLEFGGDSTQTRGAAISGNGGLVKSGTGTLTLTAANTYTGPTTISGGILKASNNGALGAATAGTTITSGGTLDVNNKNLGAEVVTAAGTGVGGAGAIINTGAEQQQAFRFVTLADDATFGGTGRWDIRNNPTATFDMGGKTMTKTGVNWVVIVSANVINPGAINLQQGVLQIANDTTMGGSSANSATVQSGTTVDLYRLTTPISWSLVLTSNATLVASSSTAATQNNWSGPVTLNGTGIVSTAASTAHTLSGPITGTGPLQKMGAGTATLSGTTTYDGGTVVTAGTLLLTGNHTYTGGTFINTGTTLQLGDGTTASGNISGDVTNAATLLFNNPTATEYAGIIRGAGTVIKQANGVQTLSGLSTYTGETQFKAGILNVASLANYGQPCALGARTLAMETVSGGLPIGPIGLRFTGGTLQYTGATPQSTDRMIRLKNGVTNTIDASGSGGGTLSFLYSGKNTNFWETGGARILQLTGSNTGTNEFAINIQNYGADATTLIKSGDGTWLVSNTHNGDATATANATYGGYTGGTVINGGWLGFATNALGSTGVISVMGNAVLEWYGNNRHDISSRLKIGDGVTATLNTGTNEVTFASAMQVGTLRSGALNKTGTGILTLAATNTYSGATTVTEGTLRCGATNALPIVTALTLAGGKLDVSNKQQTVASVSGTGTLKINPSAGPATADRLVVSGALDLMALDLELTGLEALDRYQVYRIARAGTLTGTFVSVQPTVAISGWKPFYDTESGIVTIRYIPGTLIRFM